MGGGGKFSMWGLDQEVSHWGGIPLKSVFCPQALPLPLSLGLLATMR
jgi:hypothetical protein